MDGASSGAKSVRQDRREEQKGPCRSDRPPAKQLHLQTCGINRSVKGIMTREFNKQRRDDMRPSSRKPSSGRQGEERPARPARPRLNRETVDRAWESGAQQQHADYRPRRSDGPSPRRHNNQRSEYSSSQNSRGGNRPYGNRQDQRPRPFDSDRRAPDNQRFQDRERRRYPDESNRADTRPHFQNRERHRYSNGPNGTGARPRLRNDAPPFNRGPQFRDRDQRRDSQQHDDDYRDRSPRGPTRDTRRSYRPEQNGRFSRDGQPRDTQPTRRQNRPPVRRDDTSRPRYGEQFERDYEHLDNDAPYRPRYAEGSPLRSNRERNETPERHVTRLPDGHVLKGPRPAQRKNAQFWTEVAEDTEELLDQVHTVPTEEEDDAGNVEDVKVVKTTPKKKSRTDTASATPCKKNAGTTSKPRSTGSKSPQRGS